MSPRRPAAAVLGVFLCCAVMAQTTVYRCGPQGREWSQQPCRGDGQRIELRAQDPSPEEQAAARAIAAGDARLAEQLRQERHAREAQPVPGAIAIRGVAPAAAPSSAARHGTKKKKKVRHAHTASAETEFVAVEPKPAQPRKH